MAAAVFLLDTPNPGIAGELNLYPLDLVPLADTSDGTMQIDDLIGWMSTDFNQDGSDIEFDDTAKCEANIITNSSTTGSYGISLGGVQMINEHTSNPGGEANGLIPVAHSSAGTGPGGDGSSAVTWSFGDDSTSPIGAYTGSSVHLVGALQINLLRSMSGDAFSAASFSFNSAATGVSAYASGNDLVVTHPVSGVSQTDTYTDFFLNGGGVTIPYDTYDTDPAAGESISFASSVVGGVATGDDGTSQVEEILSYGFSEVIN